MSAHCLFADTVTACTNLLKLQNGMQAKNVSNRFSSYVLFLKFTLFSMPALAFLCWPVKLRKSQFVLSIYFGLSSGMVTNHWTKPHSSQHPILLPWIYDIRLFSFTSKATVFQRVFKKGLYAGKFTKKRNKNGSMSTLQEVGCHILQYKCNGNFLSQRNVI